MATIFSVSSEKEAIRAYLGQVQCGRPLTHFKLLHEGLIPGHGPAWTHKDALPCPLELALDLAPDILPIDIAVSAYL